MLKVRVANSGDPDFIEVELPTAELTYYTLLRTCCDELGLGATQVMRIRKLPDTVSKDNQKYCCHLITPDSCHKSKNTHKSLSKEKKPEMYSFKSIKVLLKQC